MTSSSTEKPASSSIFNLSSITAAIPPGYLNYFSASKSPPDSSTANVAASDGNQVNTPTLTDINPDKVPPAAPRTWGAWAGETSLLAAGVGMGLASAAVEVTKTSVEKAKVSLEATTSTLITGGNEPEDKVWHRWNI